MSSFLLDVQIECKSPAAPLSLALHLPCFLCPEAVESGPAASAHVVVAFFHAPNNNPFNPPTPRTFSAVATPATAVTRTSAVPARDPSNLISDEDAVGGCCPTPPLAEEETTAAVKLKAKKSFNSNASLPDSAGNYSDEFGSTSLSSTRIPPPSRALIRHRLRFGRRGPTSANPPPLPDARFRPTPPSPASRPRNCRKRRRRLRSNIFLGQELRN